MRITVVTNMNTIPIYTIITFIKDNTHSYSHAINTCALMIDEHGYMNFSANDIRNQTHFTTNPPVHMQEELNIIHLLIDSFITATNMAVDVSFLEQIKALPLCNNIYDYYISNVGI